MRVKINLKNNQTVERHNIYFLAGYNVCYYLLFNRTSKVSLQGKKIYQCG